MNKLNFKKELIQINVIASIEMFRNNCNNILLYVLVVIGNLYTGKSISRGSSKYFLWVSRLWIGRRKERLLSYVTKNDEKKILAKMG